MDLKKQANNTVDRVAKGKLIDISNKLKGIA